MSPGARGGGLYALVCALQLAPRVLSATLIASATLPQVIAQLKRMGWGNRLVFFLARWAPVLLRLLFVDYARAVRKDPETFSRNMLSQFCAADQRLFEGTAGTIRSRELMHHLTEAFRQGGEASYRDVWLLVRPWALDLSGLSVPVVLQLNRSESFSQPFALRQQADLFLSQSTPWEHLIRPAIGDFSWLFGCKGALHWAAFDPRIYRRFYKIVITM